MANYSFVVDSSFNPLSMQEMLVPFVQYKDAYEKSEEAFSELSDKSDKFKYLSETLPEGSAARKIYEGYANELSKQASDLAQHGLSMNNRRALTNLRRRYQGEIGRLVTADEAMQEERKLRRNNKDTSMLYAEDNLSIDQFLDGQNPNLYSISSDDLYKRGAQAAQSASSRVYGNTQISNLNKYFQEIAQTQGYSPELITAWRQNLEAIPEFKQAVDDILAEKGVNGNLKGANYDRARQAVINGILDGAVYKESKKVEQNPGVLTAAQAASNALGRANHNESVRQHNLQLKMSGYDENGVYHPENDQTLKKAEAVAKAKIPTDENGNPIKSKEEKHDLTENESYNIQTKSFGPAPSGQNAVWGQELSLGEAMKLAPELVASCGDYTKHYRFYRNGNIITKRRTKSSVPSDDTDSSNQKNHKSADSKKHNNV